MSQSMSLRKVLPGDLESLHRIEQQCFSGPGAYSRGQLSYLAFRANSACIVDAVPRGVRGFVIVMFRKNSQIGGIETIDVSPEFRGLGIGQQLLAAAEREIISRGKSICRLEVSEGNLAAIRLYERAGYRVTDRLEDYYLYEHHGTHHALRMEKHLS